MKQEFVINWHIIEACNYSCRFCFSAWAGKDRTDLIRDYDASVALIDSIKATFDEVLAPAWGYDSLRINFAGGEPLIYREHLLKIAAYCKQLGISTSLITNGVYLLEKDFTLKDFDMIGVSIDSLEASRNLEIGRFRKYKGSQEVLDIDALQDYLVREKAARPDLEIKINTVVNAANHDEDLTTFINAIGPSRWKVFKMLPVITDELNVTDEEFAAYLARHQDVSSRVVSEDNSEMTASYLMIDPSGRFYSNEGAMESKEYQYSPKILDIGMLSALKSIDFDLEKFRARY